MIIPVYKKIYNVTGLRRTNNVTDNINKGLVVVKGGIISRLLQYSRP